MNNALLTLPLLFAACTESTSTADLECAGHEVTPHMIQPSAATSGLVLDAVGGAPIAGAVVVLMGPAGEELGVTGTTHDGTYEMTATAPAWRLAFAEAYLDAVTYDPDRSGSSLPLPMIDSASADRLARTAGIERDAGKGMLLVNVRDCAGQPVEGATVRVDGAAGPLYLAASTRFDPALTTTSTNSAALLFDVPLGNAQISVELDGLVYSSFEVSSVANTLVTTWRRP